MAFALALATRVSLLNLSIAARARLFTLWWVSFFGQNRMIGSMGKSLNFFVLLYAAIW